MLRHNALDNLGRNLDDLPRVQDACIRRSPAIYILDTVQFGFANYLVAHPEIYIALF